MSILDEDKFERREYQINISKTATDNNTLVVLPTGLGKTLISVLVGAKRLKSIPGSKILITAPSRPLNAQHMKSFEEFTNIDPDDILLITGNVRPKKREKLYKRGRIFAATPQCIRNDLESGKLNFKEFSFMTIDEAHRAVGNYAYTYIAKKFMLQSENPVILGLTASPGGNTEKIAEVIDNLFIKKVEIRSEEDEDVKPYVKGIEKDWIYVDFPEKYKRIKSLLKECFQDDVDWLKKKHYIFTDKPSKKMLLGVQRKLGARYSKGSKNYGNMWAMIRTAEAIKLDHAMGLLETQGVTFLKNYLDKLKKSDKKTDKRLMKNRRMEEILEIIEECYENEEHPKMDKIKELVKNLINDRKSDRIIIFANYRATVDKIKEILENEGISVHEFIGQATKKGKGMKQDEQIQILKDFKNKKFNVLVATSVGEEGLDVPSVDYAIFYEPVASAIRTIQRRGRVGRQVTGKVIFLITKDTRDEAYYWSAVNKEKKMKKVLYDLKNGKGIKRKKSLLDWTK